MRDLIEIMSSRFPDEALRSGSAAEEKLLSFLACLSEWELHTEREGVFLAKPTALGLRVTIASTISLLDYLTKHVGYRFLMTSRISQDPAENFFGIARQSCGCNTHPTPQQFLISVSCLSFYSLAKSVSSGDAQQGVLTALLDADAVKGERRSKQTLLDQLNSNGDLASAEHAVGTLEGLVPDHAACVSAKSDQRLIFYIAGYVARKFLLKSNCES